MPEDRASVMAGAGSIDMEHDDTKLVQIIHESVRDFLIQKRGFSMLESALLARVAQLGHSTIITTCLDYIKVK